MTKDMSRNLAIACQEAYAAYLNSCSHSVWYVISKYKPSQPYMMANQLIDYLSSSPEWHEVPLSEVTEAARMGRLVVGGLKGKEHGHVVVVYPGQERPRGGYIYTPKRTGKPTKLASKGMYPLSMSTSMGTFPGSKSNGDKTVWDAWGSDVSFEQVRFWNTRGWQKSYLVQEQ
ncbi:hypothetical protein GMST_28660 [Geomonas silvestris]|uniref:Peptidase C39-like domain-containing protein n=1 Tax=Geomonas silvestris TaxID=2740184 RepID=A0A6V8MKK0_9BACT|nr:hypothetical protein GMST_28660 [Geomonas silvestris]